MKGNDMLPSVRAVALVVVASLAVLGCKKSGGTPPEPTVPTAVPTTSTTVPIDVSLVPPVIDEAYVNAVLAALDQVDGEATREIVAAKNVTPAAADYLNAIYSDDALRLETDGWFESLADDPQLTGVRPNPGNRRTVVDRVIAASPSCIWAAVRRDYSARNVGTVPSRLEYLALEPRDHTNDPRQINPTPWMITIDGFRADGLEPSNPCVTR